MAEPGGSTGGGGAMAFSLAAKPRRGKVQVQVSERGEERQMITGIEGSRIKTAGAEAPAAGPRVIPSIGNTYRAGVGKGAAAGGFVPSFVPPSSEDALASSNQEKFVAAPQDDGTKPVVKQFGLQRMDKRQQEEEQQKQQKQQQQAGEQQQGEHQNGGAVADQAAENGRAAGTPPAPAGPPGGYGIQGRGGRSEKEKLMEELHELPDEMDPEEYEAIPVDEFARALLRGMGWRDGDGVGRTKQAVEVKQIVPRPERLGLGADPAALPQHLQKPRVVKMGDKPRQDLVAAPGADGRARHRVGLDEALVPRETTLPGPRPGKQMRVTAGRHSGFACVVKELLSKEEGRSERALVRLLPSHEEVEVRCAELGETSDMPPPRDKGPREDTRQRQGVGVGGGSGGRDKDRERDRRRELERDGEIERGGGGGKRDRARSEERRQDNQDGSGGKRQRGSSRERKRGHGGIRHQHHKQRSSSEGSSSSEDDGEGGGSTRKRSAPPVRPTWLFPSIKVRLLDKKLHGGRLYLKKGVVVDVHPGALADVALEETRQVVQLRESSLETVVPKEAGRPVQVVAGEWRGRRGRLLQVSKSGGVAAVQLSGDMAIVRLALDDVAEYMGAIEEDEDG